MGTRIANWIRNNPVEFWLVVGLLCLFAGITTLAIASANGAIPTTGSGPVVLIHTK